MLRNILDVATDIAVIDCSSIAKKKIVTTILNVIEAFLKHLLPSRTLVVIPGNLSLNKCSSSVVYLLSFIFTSVTTRTSFAT